MANNPINADEIQAKLAGLTGKAQNEPAAPEAKTEEFGKSTKTKKEIPTATYTIDGKTVENIPYIKDAEAEGGYRARTQEEAEKWYISDQNKEKKDKVSKALIAKSKIGDTERRLRELISDKLRIIGYVVSKGDKIDFSATGKKKPDSEEKEYTIALKNFAPSSLQYAIVKEPSSLIALKNEMTNNPNMPADKLVATITEYENNGISEDAYAIKYIPWDEMIPYVMANTNGIIREDDKIFTTYVDGTLKGDKLPRVYKSAEDYKGSGSLPKGSYLYLSAKLAKVKKVTVKDEQGNTKVTDEIDKKSLVTLKHSIRSRIITPANIIPLKKYQTVTPAVSYTAEDATKMIGMYLKKFSTAKDNKTPVTKNLRDPRGFTISIDGAIEKTDYFATNGAQSWFANGSNSLSHWSDKNPADGSAVQIPATSVKLVSKSEQTKKDGGIRIKTDTLDLGEAGTEYGFTAENFPKIFEAAGNLNLKWDALSKVVASKKARKAKASNDTRRLTTVAPDVLAGVSLDEIAAQLAATFGVENPNK